MHSLRKHEAGLPREIVVAVTADGLADDAIRTALDFEKRLGVRIQLVHGVGWSGLDWELFENPRRALEDEGPLALARQAVLARVREVLSSVGQDPARAEQLVHVQLGKPAKVVLDAARQRGASWVVLGALRRHSGFDFGSTARAILAQAPRAVWVQPGSVRPIKSILVPLDFSEESWRALATACVLAVPLGARVRVLHCFEAARTVVAAYAGAPDMATVSAIDEARDRSAASFKSSLKAFDWRGVAHESTFVEGMPAREILDAAKTADLVVMGTHGRTRLSSALLGSVAYSVVRQIETPVLVLRRKESQYLT